MILKHDAELENGIFFEYKQAWDGNHFIHRP